MMKGYIKLYIRGKIRERQSFRSAEHRDVVIKRWSKNNKFKQPNSYLLIIPDEKEVEAAYDIERSKGVYRCSRKPGFN